MTELNGDLSLRVAMHCASMDWQSSPGGGVLRKRLHRVGGAESGQVTSVVRYEPGAAFPAHDHPGGEEILVLEGTFSDERGDWPRGSYLLNPEGYCHSPYSTEGCLLFVKLRQYGGEGRLELALAMDSVEWQKDEATGIDARWLYRDPRFSDSTRLERWPAGLRQSLRSFPRGAEVFVLEGGFADEGEAFGIASWLRVPPGEGFAPVSEGGCVVYLKEGGVSSLLSSGGPRVVENGASFARQ